MTGFLSVPLLYVLPYLVILTIVVTIHELGHFFAARAFGVAMDRFSIGFGKALWSRTDKSGVEWRIGWIPLGGYVRFSGDSNDASVPDAEDLEGLRKQIIEQLGPEAVNRFFHFKPIWQRAVISVAGPLANFALAIVAFSILLLSVGEEISPAKVGVVTPGFPAAQAGFQTGDDIRRVNGHRIRDYNEVLTMVSLRAGEPMTFDLERNGQPVRVTVTPRRIVEKDPTTHLNITRGQIGFGPQPSFRQHYNPVQAVVRSVGMIDERISQTLTYLRRIVTGYESGDQLSSVVGMTYATGSIMSQTVAASPSLGLKVINVTIEMVLLVGVISVGIGFVNLLPIPVLDGGHLLFYGYEAVARRPAGPRLQAASLRVGLALVLCLMLFATWNDLQRLQAFKFLGGLFS